jgi:hypothetical protein
MMYGFGSMVCGYWWAGRGSMPEPTQPEDEGFMGAVFVRH